MASFTLGMLLPGPIEAVSMTDVSLSAGPEIATQLLVGNPILVVFVMVGSYIVVHRIAAATRH